MKQCESDKDLVLKNKFHVFSGLRKRTWFFIFTSLVIISFRLKEIYAELFKLMQE